MVGAWPVSSPKPLTRLRPKGRASWLGKKTLSQSGWRAIRQSGQDYGNLLRPKEEKPADHRSSSLKGRNCETSIRRQDRRAEEYTMTFRKGEILQVDDSPADVELTVHALKQGGLATSIAVAEDGEQALDYLFCRGIHQGRSPCDRPSLILLDLNLPKVDGLQVLKTLRADQRTRAIPIVILTSSKEPKDLIAGYKLGASAFIQKPVDFEEFRKTIQEIGAFWLLRNEPPPPEAFAA